MQRNSFKFFAEIFCYSSMALILNFFLALSLLSLSVLADDDIHSMTECPPWHFYNTTSNDCQCYHNHLLDVSVRCNPSIPGIFIFLGHCMTYDTKDKGTYIAKCYYFQLHHGNVTPDGYLSLPNISSELNDYMCGAMNRKGIVCGECIDGFGPSLTSYGYKCVKCKNSWRGVLLYMLIQFVPISLFYILMFIFRISLTSSPMTCYILYSQLVVYVLFKDPEIISRVFLETRDSKVVDIFIKTLAAVYGVWNMEVFNYILPPICISTRFSIIHIEVLGFLSAFYLLFLTVLSWLCIELHDRNFRLIVLLCKPFNWCSNKLNKTFNVKRDIIEIFSTFLYLAYTKLTYQSVKMLSSQYIFNDGVHYRRVSLYDPTQQAYPLCCSVSICANSVCHSTTTSFAFLSD